MSEKLNMQNHKVSKELLLDTAEKYLENAMDNLESEHPQNVRKYPEIELNTVEVPTNMVAVLNAIYLNFVKPTRKQPQLIILKNIADELDKRWETQNKYLQRKIAVPRDALYNAVNPYDNQLAATKIGKWIDENQNICFAYLAGKALGVDLVKVAEE